MGCGRPASERSHRGNQSPAPLKRETVGDFLLPIGQVTGVTNPRLR